VNNETIDLYWQVGKKVSEKTNDVGWGKSGEICPILLFPLTP
jgi:hypothetical protein